jgi:predicted dehydrogenase
MLLQGVLNSGAAVSFFLRASSASADGNSFHWIISGTKGEIIFTAGQGFIQTSPLNGKIVMRKKGEEAEEVDFTRQEGDHVAKSESTPRNILRVYEAYAGGDTDGYENIEQALQTQRLVEEVKKNAIWAP